MAGKDARKEEQMDNQTTVAVAKAIKDKDAKEAREALAPGEYEVDAFVRVTGTLRVAPDTEKTSTSSLLSEEFLIVALKLAGCTRERACEIIGDLAKGSVNGEAKANKAARKALVEEYDPEGTITAIFADVKASLPKTVVRGAVKFDGAVVEVHASEADSAVA